jgi:hypothetical protein
MWRWNFREFIRFFQKGLNPVSRHPGPPLSCAQDPPQGRSRPRVVGRREAKVSNTEFFIRSEHLSSVGLLGQFPGPAEPSTSFSSPTCHPSTSPALTLTLPLASHWCPPPPKKRYRLPLQAPTRGSLLRLFSDPINPATSSASPRSPSPTIPLAHHRRPHRSDRCHHGAGPSRWALYHFFPQISSPLHPTTLAVIPHWPSHRPPPDFGRRATGWEGGGGGNPLFPSAMGRKAYMGRPL